jgi:serine/alanine adding enzyme
VSESMVARTGCAADVPRISAVEPGDPAWEAFVEAAQDSTFCHAAGWRGITEDVLGHECSYLAARDGEGVWLGALPLVRVRSRLFGDYLVSMPFLNYGGPIGRPAARVALARYAAGMAERDGVDLLELRCREPVDSPLALSHRKVAVVLELPDTPEILWSERFPSKLRSQVRRPLKEGLEVRFGPEQVPAFYEVFSRHMRDLGTPVLPRELFERIANVFRDGSLFGAVYHGEEPIAAGCGLAWRGELEMTWAASLREYNRLAPNMLLYWSFMERAIKQRMRAFNFGRSTPGAGTHRFKRQWGGEDVPLPWLQWSARGLSATPNPDGSAMFQWATRVWQRVPLPLTRRFGPTLARLIP